MTFEAFNNGQCIFSSEKHWLYPIFEFEEFLQKWNGDRSTLIVRDKIIGRAAALLLIRLGIRQIHGLTISRLAIEILDYFRVHYTFDSEITRIACQTETILETSFDPEQAWQLIRDRISRAKSDRPQ
jgi:zinc transport system ATP-binding protein